MFTYILIQLGFQREHIFETFTLQKTHGIYKKKLCFIKF